MIGAGISAKVYLVQRCIAFSCPLPGAVKEVVGGNLAHDVTLSTKAAALGLAPPIYGHGTCQRNGVSVSFKLMQRLNPVTVTLVEAFPEEFKNQLLNLVGQLHQHGMTHGDIHLANILYDNVETPRFYLTDFDKGVSLDGQAPAQREVLMTAENERTHQLLAGDYYPPGGLPNPDTHWQPLIYKWKAFDTHHHGKIEGADVQKVVDALGSQTRGEAMAELYNIRMREQLSLEEREGLFADENNDGILTDDEARKLAQLFPHANIAAVQKKYNHFGKELRSHYSASIRQGSNREIAPGLEAKDVLIITAGDIKPTRRFPLQTAQLFAELAQNMGYRFEQYSGNLATNWVPYWSKIWFLLDRMQYPENKVIVWFDDDGIVTTRSDMLEQLLRAYPKEDLIVSMDPEFFAVLNTGALIVRNTKNAVSLLLETIRVGLEERSAKSFRSFRLVDCAQDRYCLHEQQALAELYMNTSFVQESDFILWTKFVERKREGRKDWTQYIAIVPQIDPISGRNMNIFYDPNNPYRLEGRYFLPSLIKIPYTLKDRPFFIQLAGKGEQKAKAIEDVIAARRKYKKQYFGGT